MKKVVILLVAATLIAAPAFAAGVRNSKHDLSTSSTSAGTVKDDAGGVDEVCVFCHTPHGGVVGKLAPLWNRSRSGANLLATQLYNSATLDSTNSNPTKVLGAVNNSDAPLCLSCHDGGTLSNGLVNPSSAGQPSSAALTAGVTGMMDIMDGAAGVNALTNDHPIGMDYGAVVTADGAGFVAEATVEAALPLYDYAGGRVMWCSSCHDVHNQGPAGATPFLNLSNAGSALCTTCHIK